ncbi:MAG: putative quinol monooxygenase [Smithellaceae bacterium]
MICVIATVNLNEGKRDAYLAELQKIIPDVRKEDGNIEYVAYIDFASGVSVLPPVRPDTVTIIEKWGSMDALKKHMTAPHMASYAKATKGIVQSMQVQVIAPA